MHSTLREVEERHVLSCADELTHRLRSDGVLVPVDRTQERGPLPRVHPRKEVTKAVTKLAGG